MRKILVVEDSPPISRLVASVAIKAGCTVDVAATIAEARKAASRGGYDMAFVDVAMPDGSGLEIASELKTFGLTRTVVVMSGSASDAEAFASGADSFLSKPFTPDDIERELESSRG